MSEIAALGILYILVQAALKGTAQLYTGASRNEWQYTTVNLSRPQRRPAYPT